MFGNFVVESAQAGAGTGAFALNGTAANTPYIGFITARGNGSKWVYLAESTITRRWEVIVGVVTAGSPNTLSRVATLESWDGVTRGTSPINWTSGDGVLRIMGVIAAQTIDGVVSSHRGTTAPAWAVPGTIWIDATGGPGALAIKQMKADGATWATLSTFDEATGLNVLAGNATVALGAVPKQQAESIAAAAVAAVVPTGSITLYAGAAAPSGWLFLNGSTIGDGSSGGTARANADTAALFTLLWNDTTNTELVIQDSGGTPTTRGANAAADYAAHKRLPLPDFRDYFPRGKSGARANLSTQTDAMQAHEHLVSMDGSAAANMQTRNSLGSDEGIAKVNNGAGSSSNPFYVRGATEGGSGGGTSRTATETRPKNIAINFMVKL